MTSPASLTGQGEFYIVDLRPEWRGNPYVTVWRPNNAGYAYPLPWAGKYAFGDLRPGYHAKKNDGRRWLRFPVPCDAVERLAIECPADGRIDGNVGPVLPNTTAVRQALRQARYIPVAKDPTP